MTIFSKHWKKIGPVFQSLENVYPHPLPSLKGAERGEGWDSKWPKRPLTPALSPRCGARENGGRSGSALIVALWVLIIMSLLVGAFAFDMYVESGITSHFRKRLQAQYLARAGVEYARMLLAQSFEVNENDEVEEDREAMFMGALNLKKGIGLSGFSQELGGGKFTLDIMPEQGRRDINSLSDEDWEEILDQANIPDEGLLWEELIDCFTDWVDASDEKQLNGAESDDPFYEDRGYECKNARVDTVDELLLIKGFTPAIVYGGPPLNEGGDPLKGIANVLTAWGGSGKVNVNTATSDVLMTIPGMEEWQVEDIMMARGGEDGIEGNKDDGITDLGKIPGLTDAVKGRLTTDEHTYVRVISVGEVHGIQSGIWCVFHAESGSVTPVFWREEPMK